jgi:hypothetical protein
LSEVWRKEARASETATGRSGLVYSGIGQYPSKVDTGKWMVASNRPNAAIHGQASRITMPAEDTLRSEFEDENNVRPRSRHKRPGSKSN